MLSLDEKSIAILREIFKPKLIGKDGFLIQNGEQSTEIGFILKGFFRSLYIDQNGNDVTKCFHVQDEILFSYYAHLSQTKAQYSIQALDNSEILVTKISEFERWKKGTILFCYFTKRWWMPCSSRRRNTRAALPY